MTVGIRELKNNLSHYVREAERGKRVSVTAHGRVVAHLVPATPGAKSKSVHRLTRWEQMVADGRIHPAAESGDPFEGEDLTALLPPGSSAEWLDWSREDK